MKKLEVVSLIKGDKVKAWKETSLSWEKYFNINHEVINPKKIASLLNKKIDILFLEEESVELFKFNYYGIFQNNNDMFKYVLLKKDFEPETEALLYKNLADDIVHYGDETLAKWSSIAVLRRYWNMYAKKTTKIYKTIIADFIENNFSVNGKEISLTSKEARLLRLFMDNRKTYFTKDQLFKKVWKIKDEDRTRVVDQILFKLKKKIGKEFFTTSRAKGVMFEWKE